MFSIPDSERKKRSQSVREELMHDALARTDVTVNVASFAEYAHLVMKRFAEDKRSELSIPISNPARRPTRAIFADWFEFSSNQTFGRIVKALEIDEGLYDEGRIRDIVINNVYKEFSSVVDPNTLLLDQ